ncbi:putative transcriptional regulator, TetR family protein [Kineosporia sp. NBRC 101677]|nr:putative transcriptional regulator, TetR family protein [Kineosporia sp. NBRC 101677]
MLTRYYGLVNATPSPGRPRSQQARQAVLEAADDLLVEIGYAAMTMKNIAERAGVGRPTVYRWWSSKAEILIEACAEDAVEDLVVENDGPCHDPLAELLSYLKLLNRFLATEPPGLAYRALIGEAQHDPRVAELVREADLLAPPSIAVLERVRGHAAGMPETGLARAQLTGPLLAHVMTTGTPASDHALQRHAEILLTGWQ